MCGALVKYIPIGHPFPGRNTWPILPRLEISNLEDFFPLSPPQYEGQHYRRGHRKNRPRRRDIQRNRHILVCKHRFGGGRGSAGSETESRPVSKNPNQSELIYGQFWALLDYKDKRQTGLPSREFILSAFCRISLDASIPASRNAPRSLLLHGVYTLSPRKCRQEHRLSGPHPAPLLRLNRGWSRPALIVLAFAFLRPLPACMTPSSGRSTRPDIITSSRLKRLPCRTAARNSFLHCPSPDSAENASSIDVDAVVTGNLFKPGFNFTLPPTTHLDMAKCSRTQSLAAAGGSRIWLDNEGSLLPSIPLRRSLRTTDDHSQAWSCSGADEGEWARVYSVVSGRPLIWWDGAQYEYLQPLRHENPWAVLGTGGDTAVMKQVFTVTKGAGDTPSSRPVIRKLADVVIAAQANHSNFMGGTFSQGTTSVSSTSIEFFTNITTFYDKIPLYSALRITTSTIALIRSETLPAPVTPLSPCPGRFFSNLATGGQVRSTSCYLAPATQDPTARFLGQLDTSAVLLLTDLLGDGRAGTSGAALSDSGLRWYEAHTEHMDQVLVSRGLLLGGDRSSVPVDVRHTVAALSYLQLLLCLLPALAVPVSMFLISRDRRGYFQSSLLAAVHTSASGSKRAWGHSIHKLEEIGVGVVDGHVQLVTPGGGVLANVAPDGVLLPAEKDGVARTCAIS
ncbi:hypothetical protein BD779DRAFT_1788920 [Infundibulicybe gibba]|nr:hypothetical protein BD779DRAFT_1788920 [Infundibulicybe gibba]